MIWSWGFLWKDIRVDSSRIAIDATAFGNDENGEQGTGVSAFKLTHLRSAAG